MVDTLDGVECSEYIPMDAKTKAKLRIEALPDLFKTDEKELKPLSMTMYCKISYGTCLPSPR